MDFSLLSICCISPITESQNTVEKPIMSIRSVFSPGLFTGKVAIVTGGATGIGVAITQELSFLGCNVMIASRNIERLESAEKRMNENKNLRGTILSARCNIRKEEDVVNLMSATLKKFGTIDFLVNNSGGQFVSKSKDITAKGWHAVVETNLTGTFNCCREAYKAWMFENGGVIVNITANMWNGIPGMSHTSAARAGVVNLTKTLALEWASSGVRINSIAPGIVPSETARANYEDPEVFEKSLELQPTSRFGQTAEISAAVCFLLSPAASFITGETLKVDGAESLYRNYINIPKHDKLPPWSWGSEPNSKL